MYVPIELDKTRNFRYGMKAMSYVEKKFKKPIAKVNLNELTMEEAATVICAGLMHEDKKLTPDKVMDLIDEKGNFKEALKAMGEAINLAFGGNEADIIEEKND